MGGIMFFLNGLVILMGTMLITNFMSQNNYINEDTRATLTMGSKEYEIVIPKDTLFTVECSTQNQKKIILLMKFLTFWQMTQSLE